MIFHRPPLRLEQDVEDNMCTVLQQEKVLRLKVGDALTGGEAAGPYLGQEGANTAADLLRGRGQYSAFRDISRGRGSIGPSGTYPGESNVHSVDRETNNINRECLLR